MSEVERFDENTFIKDFIKKFDSVLMKAPIQARAKIIGLKVEIEIAGFSKVLNFELDYNKTVKDNIFDLKTILYNDYYPIIEFIKEEKHPYSSSEIEEMIASGIPLTDALSKQKVLQTKQTFKINRVLIPKDYIFLKNIDSNQEKMYKLKMPLSIFLKRMREKWDIKETSDTFKEYAEFKKDIFPSKEWKEINNNSQEELN